MARASPSSEARVAFISGPIDVSQAYLKKYYKPLIDRAISRGEHFVLGPIPGIDTLALAYLLSGHESRESVAPSRITVYMAAFEYSGILRALREELEAKGINVLEAGSTTRERDAAMTRASDYDILRYRTERECKSVFGKAWRKRVSSTEMNERRRAALVEGDASMGEVERYIMHSKVKDNAKGMNMKRLDTIGGTNTPSSSALTTVIIIILAPTSNVNFAPISQGSHTMITLRKFSRYVLQGVLYLGAFSRFTHGVYTPSFHAYQVDRAPNDSSTAWLPVVDVMLGTLLFYPRARVWVAGLCVLAQGGGLVQRIGTGKSILADLAFFGLASAVALFNRP